MGDLTIRDLDHALIVQLKRRAWYQGLPLEESIRRLLVASIVDGNEEFDRVEPQRTFYSGDGSERHAPLHA